MAAFNWKSLSRILGAFRSGDRTGDIRMDCAPPKMLWVEITNRCNFDCIYCTYPRMKRAKESMSFETFKCVIDMIAAGDLEHGSGVGLHMMGEPFLHPKIFDFVAYMNSRGLSADLYTNGSLMRPETIDRLSELDVLRLVISIQAPNEAAHVQARPGVKLTWEEYVSRIRDSVAHYLTRIESGEEIGLRRIDILFMSSFYFSPNVTGLTSWEECLQLICDWQSELAARAGNSRRHARTIRDPDNIYRFQIYRRNSHNVNIGIRESGCWAGDILDAGRIPEIPEGFCPNPFEQLLVLSNGDVTVCCEDTECSLKIGSIHETGLKEIWCGENANRLRRGMREHRLVEPFCRRCFGARHAVSRTEPGGMFYSMERWGETGPNFCWMGRNAGRIMVFSSRNPELDIKILSSAYCSPDDPQTVTIEFDGAWSHSIEITRPNEWQAVRAILPEEFRDRFVHVAFSTDRIAIEIPGDNRELGIAVAFPDEQDVFRD